jgi:hypothetical protein
MALASGYDLEPLLGELTEVVQQAGPDHRKSLRREALPVAGIPTVLRYRAGARGSGAC